MASISSYFGKHSNFIKHPGDITTGTCATISS
jgi:hypothetical protein